MRAPPLLLLLLALSSLPICVQAEAAARELNQQNPSAAPASFTACVSRLQTLAEERGITPALAQNLLGNLTPIKRVLASDRSQPEFVRTFTEYFATRVNEQRVAHGRRLLAQHRDLLGTIERQYGIPPHYLLALWGLETNFGNYFGKLSIPAALTTLACDSRRAKFFEGELMAVLEIVQSGDMAADQLIGSWAGAIGHMQFMPSTFLAHAVDGDADGRRDLMNRRDALNSGANYLNSLGWVSGFRWGREVQLPSDFDYAQTGSDQWQPLGAWRKLGVRDAFGNPIAGADIEAAVLLPAGHTGPAFLVYPNYKIILNWNRSHFYALSVGRLADRIAGAAPLQRKLPAPENIRLSSKRIRDLQQQLNESGFPAGKPDGVFGSGTSAAVRKAQQHFGLLADGYPTNTLFAALAKAGQ